MKTSSWKPPAALGAGAAPALDFAVLTLSVRIYSPAVPNTGAVPLLGALQVLLDCLRNRIVASIETEDGELLVATSDNGQYTAYKEGLSVALKIMDSVRAEEYRRGYGDALDWMLNEQKLAQMRQEERAQGEGRAEGPAELTEDATPPLAHEPPSPSSQEQEDASPRAGAQGAATSKNGPDVSRQNNARARKRDAALGDLLRPKSAP